MSSRISHQIVGFSAQIVAYQAQPQQRRKRENNLSKQHTFSGKFLCRYCTANVVKLDQNSDAIVATSISSEIPTYVHKCMQWRKWRNWRKIASCWRFELDAKSGKGWRSGESVRLPPFWPGFKFLHRFHMWIEFVVCFLLCFERFFSGYSGFPLASKKPTFPNSSSTRN